MLKLLDVQNLIKYVQSVGMEPFFHGLAETIEADFKRWGEFDKMARVASHSPAGVIELMPTDDGKFYGFKYVNGHPKNFEKTLQTVTAYGMLADVDTGYPLFISELTLTTAFRTGATSVMAAKYLARKNSSVMAIIGNGAQSEFQALAFKASMGIKTLRLFDIDRAAMEKTKKNLDAAGFDVYLADTPHDAVKGADIITTVTADKKCAKILTDDMIQPGVHINAVGGDCPGKTELEKAILLRSDIFVEFPEQTWIEGEIQQLDKDHPITELWEVILGKKAGRTSDEQITVFDSVGFAIEDFASLRYLYEQLKDTDYLQDVDLLSVPTDPKNLYGLLNGTDTQNREYLDLIPNVL